MIAYCIGYLTNTTIPDPGRPGRAGLGAGGRPGAVAGRPADRLGGRRARVSHQGSGCDYGDGWADRIAANPAAALPRAPSGRPGEDRASGCLTHRLAPRQARNFRRAPASSLSRWPRSVWLCRALLHSSLARARRSSGGPSSASTRSWNPRRRAADLPRGARRLPDPDREARRAAGISGHAQGGRARGHRGAPAVRQAPARAGGRDPPYCRDERDHRCRPGGVPTRRRGRARRLGDGRARLLVGRGGASARWS